MMVRALELIRMSAVALVLTLSGCASKAGQTSSTESSEKSDEIMARATLSQMRSTLQSAQSIESIRKYFTPEFWEMRDGSYLPYLLKHRSRFEFRILEVSVGKDQILVTGCDVLGNALNCETPQEVWVLVRLSGGNLAISDVYEAGLAD